MISSLLEDLRGSDRFFPLSDYLRSATSARALVQAAGSILLSNRRFHEAVEQATSDDVEVMRGLGPHGTWE